MKRQHAVLGIIIAAALTACMPTSPIIEKEIEKIDIRCLETDALIEITDPVRLQAVKEEINSSKREGIEEFELAEGHIATLRFDDGSEWEMTFYPSGHAVIEGYYVRSELEDFCGE